MRKRMFYIIKLFLVLFVFSVALVISSKSVEAATNKKSVTVTLNKKKNYCSYKINVKKNAQVYVSVKILNVTGKATPKTIYWGYYECTDGKGSCFYSLKTKKIKKGAVLNSDDYLHGSGGVTFHLPDGMKKIKIKITFKAAKGKKIIKSVKKSSRRY